MVYIYKKIKMQYKIPVQIENEDPILWPLSLRQLIICVIGFWLWYWIFKSLAPVVWTEIAAIPSLLVAWISFVIAIFKYSEMTFVAFMLSFIRYAVNLWERKWIKWVDSFSALDIWYVTNMEINTNEKVDTSSKKDKIKDLEEQLKNI